jgi:hypothetical protein
MKPWPAFILLAALPLSADEGMWLFQQFPKDTVNEKHKFPVTEEFLERLRLGSARIGGGSGAFVSPEGLLITNQHLITDCLARVSPEGKDYLKDGFYAPSRDAEVPCPGLQASVLVSTEDVTEKVKAASAGANLTPAQALELRTAAIEKIEKECSARTGNPCAVVKLFSGGRYDLYQYKAYNDLRLVFAPEHDLAYFGRERDSITYLRYGLDIAFLRAWKDGKPAATPNFLRWSAEGVKEGDLVFGSGNPQPTLRLATAAQLLFYRDASLPVTIKRLQARIGQLRELALQSLDNRKIVEPVMTEFLALFKVAAAKYIGVRDDRLVARKFSFEGKVRRAVERDPNLGEQAAKVWSEVAAAYKTWAPNERLYQVLESSPAPGSRLFRMARDVVRLAAERGKPEAERLREYRQEGLAAAEKALAETPAIHESLEILLLTQYLEELKALNDKEIPLKAILGGKQPQQAAEAYVKATRLKDPAERKRLSASREAVQKSDDGMIRLALLLDEPARRLRKKREQTIESLETSATEKIAQYRFQLFGHAEYPDANNTPRVCYGLVKSYMDRAGVFMPHASTFGGLYYRKNNEGPYQVPQRWVDLKPALDLVKPLNFVSTCDIGGGDAGSPVVNRAGELVGVTFDGNLESLPGIYLYTDDKARAVHVAVQGIVESLAKVYQAGALLRELGAGGVTAAPPAAPAGKQISALPGPPR